MTAYYNEHDPFAAAWLRNLIAGGMIAPGDVDERSIEDVVPLELAKYTQCHFFAGVGVWSHALRRAGWADDRHVWTGSCPCQPFSAAGEGAGFADERHLWPAFFHLISQCGPDVIFGEQVANGHGFTWLDLVQTDMEATGYAFGALDTCAAGFGAPHIRQRTYWVAHTARQFNNGSWDAGPRWRHEHSNDSATGGLADVSGARPFPSAHARIHSGEESARPRNAEPERQRTAGRVAVAECARPQGRGAERGLSESSRQIEVGGYGLVDAGRRSPTNSVWSFVDWLRCRDEFWRPVEAGTFPLVNGAENRVGLLRGYGNAIVAPQAEEHIRAFMAYAP